MKSFKFKLERMRDYKEQILDREKGKLRQLRKQRDEIEERILSLERHVAEKKKELYLREQAGMPANEIRRYQYIFKSARFQQEQLQAELARAEAEVERQLKVVIAASQEVSGLDKLEEKQLAEYQLAVAKSNELEISEYISSQMIRKQVNAD